MGKKSKKNSASAAKGDQASASESVTTRRSTILATVVAVVAVVCLLLKDVPTAQAASSPKEEQQEQGQGCHPKRQDLCSTTQLQKAQAAHYHFTRGRDLTAQGLELDAVKAYEAALRIDNATAFASAASQNLGLLLAKRDGAAAMVALRHAVHLDPESFYAHNSFAVALGKGENQDDWPLAEKHYEIALDLAKGEENPPGQSLPVVVLTSHGDLLRRMAHRSDAAECRDRNVLSKAHDKLTQAVNLAQEGEVKPELVQTAAIALQDVLRREGDMEERERLLGWAVQVGIWRDKRQYTRVFNHALYDAMPKPVNPWLDNLERFPVLQRAKKVWREIRDEFDHARRRGLRPVGQRVDKDVELYDRRGGQDWSEFPLIAEGKEFGRDVAPLTLGIFRDAVAPIMGQVSFSAVAPGTRIEPHCGPTNEMITCHLGLWVPEASIEELGIAVGGEARQWTEGEWICFEDSFEHEVWNYAAATRAVLLVNLKHPYIR